MSGRNMLGDFLMSDVKMKTDSGGSRDVEALMDALQFEKEKNEVLLNEVVALEDEMVNRQLQEFEGVYSEETSAFWRDQLLSNREAAVVALSELKQARESAGSAGSGKRPLHNRERSRPLPRRGLVGEGGSASVDAGSKAVRIRNRAQELCKSDRMPFSLAFRQAEKEICEEGGR
jgi:hypothetical protein